MAGCVRVQRPKASRKSWRIGLAASFALSVTDLSTAIEPTAEDDTTVARETATDDGSLRPGSRRQKALDAARREARGAADLALLREWVPKDFPFNTLRRKVGRLEEREVRNLPPYEEKLYLRLANKDGSITVWSYDNGTDRVSYLEDENDPSMATMLRLPVLGTGKPRAYQVVTRPMLLEEEDECVCDEGRKLNGYGALPTDRKDVSAAAFLACLPLVDAYEAAGDKVDSIVVRETSDAMELLYVRFQSHTCLRVIKRTYQAWKFRITKPVSPVAEVHVRDKTDTIYLKDRRTFEGLLRGSLKADPIVYQQCHLVDLSLEPTLFNDYLLLDRMQHTGVKSMEWRWDLRQWRPVIRGKGGCHHLSVYYNGWNRSLALLGWFPSQVIVSTPGDAAPADGGKRVGNVFATAPEWRILWCPPPDRLGVRAPVWPVTVKSLEPVNTNDYTLFLEQELPPIKKRLRIEASDRPQPPSLFRARFLEPAAKLFGIELKVEESKVEVPTEEQIADLRELLTLQETDTPEEETPGLPNMMTFMRLVPFISTAELAGLRLCHIGLDTIETPPSPETDPNRPDENRCGTGPAASPSTSEDDIITEAETNLSDDISGVPSSTERSTVIDIDPQPERTAAPPEEVTPANDKGSSTKPILRATLSFMNGMIAEFYQKPGNFWTLKFFRPNDRRIPDVLPEVKAGWPNNVVYSSKPMSERRDFAPPLYRDTGRYLVESREAPGVAETVSENDADLQSETLLPAAMVTTEMDSSKLS